MTITIHHLQVSQSERIPWLCEELGIDYILKIYKRSPVLAPPEYKALHPLGTAPIIHDTNGNLTLPESCTIIEYLSHRYGEGRLFLPPSHANYADFLFWWHFSNASFQSTAGRTMGVDPDSPWFAPFLKRRETALKLMDNRLTENTWLAGNEFTAADIVIVFSLTTFRYFAPYSLAEYPHVLAYLQRIAARPAYKKAMQKSDPNLVLALEAEPPKPNS